MKLLQSNFCKKFQYFQYGNDIYSHLCVHWAVFIDADVAFACFH
ncbi:hypothetical protein HMPREF9098_1699 [Kingella denitrificans ATCC 33394]|uniref:Uncharacterized protein n=1 Tax=Kingella denitrificans ATCC 33394 TaxID=888741 RepID=F0F0R4_9NEIS|nr:hypothetical protein HMPREF9098_1699 [Kingella denitrificans ATCC 33394]